VELGLNGRPMLCDPDRWEFASVESSAVACEWGCGSLSLPYFQRNKILQRSRDRITLNTQSPRQTSMQLNQFTFEDSIEIDNSVSEVCRISIPPSDFLFEHNGGENPISSSSKTHPKSGSPKGNQENVLRALSSRSLTTPFPMQFRSRGVTERVDKLIGAISEESGFTMDTIDSHKTIPIIRVQSSPSNLSTTPHRSRKNRPPPCPGRRAPLGTRPQRTKRRQNKWRERITARSNSIFDDVEEDSDNSDEDTVVFPLQPEGTRLM
jgi:hypothetical protein